MTNQTNLKEAATHFAGSLIVAKNVEPASAQTIFGVEIDMHVTPCTGWCQSDSQTINVMRFVANDRKRTMHALNMSIKLSTVTHCNECGEKHNQLASALTEHAAMLQYRSETNDAGAEEAIFRRDRILNGLGYRVF